MNSLKRTAPYIELQRRSPFDPVAGNLKARLDLAFPSIERVLRDTRRYFQHFTDHSVDHSVRILRNIGCLLRKSQYRLPHDHDAHDPDAVLSSIDLFLLIGSALLHDIGMVVAESELDDLAERPDFKKIALGWVDDDADWYRKGVPRLLLAEYVRRHHPERSCSFTMDEEAIPTSLVENSPQVKYWLGLTAAAHGMDRDGVLDESKFPTRVEVGLGGDLQQECNPRFVALCLRLGDLLDISTSRACPLLRSLSEPLAAVSSSHWDQYQDIYIAGLKPEQDIRVCGTCPTQDAERFLREWIGWLEDEASEDVRALNTGERRYRLALGRIQYEVQPAKSQDGTPVYEFLKFRFNLDEKSVFERLFGKALYGRPELALRELIQNAVDAHRALLVERCSHSPDWTSCPDEEKEVRLRNLIDTQSQDMPISIVLATETEDTGKGRLWLTVDDQGIGMSRDSIGRYLLKVGRSRWGEDPMTARLGVGSQTIGTFGIGFLSTLMLADKIVVDTRSYLPDESAVMAAIYGWQGFLSTSPSQRTGHGTAIAMLLKDGVFSDSGDIIRELALQVPLVDFPMEVVHKDNKLRAPQISRDVHDKQTCLPLGTDGSRLILRTGSRPKDNTVWSDAKALDPQGLALCQDGIAVGGMRLPSAKATSASVLKGFHPIIDLRGGSRVPLDLSRNLIEGDVGRFWKQMIPKIWKSIAVAARSDRIARLALSTLVEHRTLLRVELPHFFTRDGRLVRGLDSLAGIKTVTAVETPHFQFTSQDGTNAIWMCPPASGDSPSTPSGHVKEHGRPKTRDQYRREEKIFLNIRRQTDNAVDNWQRITREFPWISRERGSPLLLARRRTAGSVHIASLLGFEVTESWRAVFHMRLGRPVVMFADGFTDLALQAKKKRLSFADLLVFLCLSVNPWAPEGKMCKDKLQWLLSQAARLLKNDPTDSDRKEDWKWTQGEEEEEEEAEEKEDLRHYVDYLPTLDREDADRHRGLAQRCGLESWAPDWEDYSCFLGGSAR